MYILKNAYYMYKYTPAFLTCYNLAAITSEDQNYFNHKLLKVKSSFSPHLPHQKMWLLFF